MILLNRFSSIVKRTLTDKFDNQYVPAYYVFDKDGQLRHFQAGGGGMKMLEKRVNRVLDEMKKESESARLHVQSGFSIIRFYRITLST